MIRTSIVIIVLGVGIASGQTNASKPADLPPAKQQAKADPVTQTCRSLIARWRDAENIDLDKYTDAELRDLQREMIDCEEEAKLTPPEFRVVFRVYGAVWKAGTTRDKAQEGEAQAKLNDDPVTHNCRALMTGWPKWKDVDMDAYTYNDLASLMSATVPCIDNANLTPSEFRSTFHVYAGALAISHNRDRDGWKHTLDENDKLVKDYNSLVDRYNLLLGYTRSLAVSRQFTPATSIHCTSNRIGDFVYTDCN